MGGGGGGGGEISRQQCRKGRKGCYGKYHYEFRTRLIVEGLLSVAF